VLYTSILAAIFSPRSTGQQFSSVFFETAHISRIFHFSWYMIPDFNNFVISNTKKYFFAVLPIHAILMKIQEAQNHTDPNPQRCFFV
jgi:hypothetical protein